MDGRNHAPPSRSRTGCARGYRWGPGRKVWGREVRDRDRLAEEFWLAANTYSFEARPRGGSPAFEPVDWTVRYA